MNGYRVYFIHSLISRRAKKHGIIQHSHNQGWVLLNGPHYFEKWKHEGSTLLLILLSIVRIGVLFTLLAIWYTIREPNNDFHLVHQYTCSHDLLNHIFGLNSRIWTYQQSCIFFDASYWAKSRCMTLFEFMGAVDDALCIHHYTHV